MAKAWTKYELARSYFKLLRAGIYKWSDLNDEEFALVIKHYDRILEELYPYINE